MDSNDSRSNYSEAMQASYAAKVRRAHLTREIIEVALLIGIIVVAIKLGIETYGLSAPDSGTPTTSSPMSPAINYGQNVIVSKLSYVLGSPQRGDVIVYADPLHASDQSLERIQRIIGIPGDVVLLTPTSVSINGKVLTEPYATVLTTQATGIQVTLGKNQYFVLDDNRSSGCNNKLTVTGCFDDSRNPLAMGVDISKNPGGSLDRKYIVGKVVFIYWPLNQMHGVNTYSSTFSGLK